MNEITVSLRDSHRVLHVTAHEGFADITLGALSAEPETIDELLDATLRFVDQDVLQYFLSLEHEELATRSANGGQVIIDLSAQLLVNGTNSPDFPVVGTITRCDKYSIYDMVLPYRLSADWLQTRDINNWESLAIQRREQRKDMHRRDWRTILYDRVAAFLVGEWSLHAATMSDPIVEIHDRWLLTSRVDLNGRTPRDILLEKRDFIDGDIRDQTETWTLLKRQPPGLSTESAAFRFGGFGTHEIIFYHELVSELLLECQRWLSSDRDFDFDETVRHLEQHQQEWLHQPCEDLYHQSPAAMIARERSRLPAVVPADQQPLEDDCPLCQMMAQDDRPFTWHIDNWYLCKRFSTSFCASFEDWKSEYGDWFDEDDAIWNDVKLPEQSLPKTPSMHDAVWNYSFTNMASVRELPTEEAIPVLVFALAGHLAELGMDLQLDTDTQWMFATLQSHHSQLRDAVEDQKLWSIHLSVDQFAEQLQRITQTRPDLRSKCQDLEDKLNELAHKCHQQFGPGRITSY
jgi:hypothetical protein